MSNKNSKTDLVLTSAENLADEILFKTANTFLENAAKSIPFASLISSSIQAYTRFRTLKEQKQLLAFIQETEANNQDFIKHFFQDKHNTELGLEPLGILDQTYLEHQARMIGRAVLLKYNGEISKQEFDKYTYIITKLNNHLIYLIQSLVNTGKDFEAEMHDTGNPLITVIGVGMQMSFPSPNMDLVSFGFLEEYSNENKQMINSLSQYRRTQFFYQFYETIFKD